MLDDIYHCKHFKTLQFLKQDSRFKILVEAEEKFGFCIAHFRPQIEVTEIKKKSYGSDQMRSEITFSQATPSALYKTYTAGK